jgi:outer membrane protein assembly factor BamB
MLIARNLAVACITSLFCAASSSANWPQFRGSGASGSDPKPGPVEWDVSTSKGIRWKVPVPGLGHSCPVIWGDRVFLTTAVPVAAGDERLKTGLYGDIGPVEENAEYRWLVLCFDKATGKQLWEREARRGVPKVKRHPKSSHANSTPATDGKRLVAFFGSEGLYCFDLDGKPLWQKDFGVLDSGFFAVPDAQWGFASSPVLFEDAVIVLADVQKDSFLASFDATTGEQRWRIGRNDVPTWGTPTVHREGERTQILVNGYKEIAGYNVADGKKLWTMSGGGDIPVPTPVVAHGLTFITSAHGPQSPIFAITLSAAQGDISLPKGQTSSDAVAWSIRQGGNYMQTPLVVGDYLYGFTASLVAAGDRVYVTSEDGRVMVVKAGPRFGLMAENELGEQCLATPAVSDGTIYFRTRGHLIAVGTE